MKITLDEIPEEGALDVEFSAGREAFDELFEKGLERDFRFISPVKGSFHISRSKETVFIELEIESLIKADCSLCLVEFDYPIQGSSRLTLTPEEETVEKEIALDEEEIAKGIYSGERLDLDEILREEAALLLPFSPKCREGCRGLCNSCGQNLNEGECSCIDEKPSGSFDALKNLKL